MPNLTAKFSIDVTAPCLLEFPDECVPEVQTTIKDFDVLAKLVRTEHHRQKFDTDLNWTTELSVLELLVSRNEVDLPPQPTVTTTGAHDLTRVSAYLRAKQGDFMAIALEACNRVFHYFKYSLGTPFVQNISSSNYSLHNPTWLDASGVEIRGQAFTMTSKPILGFRGELGTKKLTPASLPELAAFLASPTDISLDAELLSDAQTAWYERNYRRSVLELAICAEVMVKRKYFAAASPAGAAFDYMEDKARVSVRVLELLDTVALEAFARSYKQEERTNYNAIDNLFRCRNKIAHRGELTFRNDSSQLVSTDGPMIEHWWQAVANLRMWLQSLE